MRKNEKKKNNNNYSRHLIIFLSFIYYNFEIINFWPSLHLIESSLINKSKTNYYALYILSYPSFISRGIVMILLYIIFK